MTTETTMTVDEAIRILDSATLTPEMAEVLDALSPSEPTVSVPVEALRVLLADGLDRRLTALADTPETTTSAPASAAATATARSLTFTNTLDTGIAIEARASDAWARILIDEDGEIADCAWGPT